jgi:hypothetical protein
MTERRAGIDRLVGVRQKKLSFPSSDVDRRFSGLMFYKWAEEFFESIEKQFQ